ncbi:unnamed protein product [Ixodes pacificus]
MFFQSNKSLKGGGVRIGKGSAGGPLEPGRLGWGEGVVVNTSRGRRPRETGVLYHARFGTRVFCPESERAFRAERTQWLWSALFTRRVYIVLVFLARFWGVAAERQRQTVSGRMNYGMAHLVGAIHTGVGCPLRLAKNGFACIRTSPTFDREMYADRGFPPGNISNCHVARK